MSIVKFQSLTAGVLKSSVGNTNVFLKTGMGVFEPVVNNALEAISEIHTFVANVCEKY